MHTFEIGTDCIHVSSLEGKTNSDRIFTEAEIKYCESKFRPMEHFAGRFAAKEATIKALSGFISNLKLKDVQILNDSSGKPYVKLNTEYPTSLKIKLSLSHTSELAIASAIAYLED